MGAYCGVGMLPPLLLGLGYYWGVGLLGTCATWGSKGGMQGGIYLQWLHR